MIDVLLIFLTTLIAFCYWKSWSQPLKFPPGPRRPLPIFGDAYILGNDLVQGLSGLRQKYGKLVGFWLGPQRAVLVSDFELLQDLLSKSETADRLENPTAFKHYTRRGTSLGSTPGVLFSNGWTWVEMRRTSLQTLRDLGFGKSALEDIIEEEIDNLVQHIDQHYLNKPVDIKRFFNVAVLASLWRIISGERLKIGDPKLEHLIKVVNDMIKDSGHPLLGLTMNLPNVFKVLSKLGILNFKKQIDQLFEFNKEVLENHKLIDHHEEHHLTFTEAMLHKIRTTSDPNHPMHGQTGELNLLNVLLDFFIAGSDTTSVTMNWAMLYMILNPEIQQRVREELGQKIGTHQRAKMSDRSLTPYTEAVLHEVQRKGNILPIAVMHRTVETETLTIGKEKYELPPKTLFVPFIGDIMNDPKHFAHPDQFDPERFLVRDQNGIRFQPDPRVIPFGIGKRRCLGEALARTSLYKFFTALIQKYEIVSGQAEPISDEADAGFIKSPLQYHLVFKPVAN